MKKNLLLLSSPFFLLVSLIIMGSGEAYVAADFVGSAACAGCHADKYGDWEESGHPYKFTLTPGNEGPVYPVEAINLQSQWMDSLGDGSHHGMILQESLADMAGKPALLEPMVI